MLQSDVTGEVTEETLADSHSESYLRPGPFRDERGVRRERLLDGAGSVVLSAGTRAGWLSDAPGME